jgi:N-sulfoglucosamine sulfohydrolase
MYACSIGSQHMRCKANLPDYVRCFPHYLREAGYYCTNNVKTDYNFNAPPGSWDESSNKAHWRKRKSGQPFFSVFNFTSCHESQIRLREAEYQRRTADFTAAERHDPAKAPIPPYHPDVPEVRRDWARYADMITFMDKEVGRVLNELEEDKLAEDTIVFYFSDHGAGMPRGKRWLYDSSTRVPLIVRFPKKYQQFAPGKAGGTDDWLVSFVDFAPTVLSLAGIAAPSHLQGIAFLGEHKATRREYIHGYRDRMDERYDLIRTTRDQRFRYIRNYMPQLPYFHHQHISYMYEMPTMQAWQRLADAGTLTGAPLTFMAASKPMEELYDTSADPWEVNNLADSPQHRPTLERLRAECRRWQAEIIDLGLMPEADLRSRFGAEAPYAAVRRDPNAFPLRRIAEAADLANERNPNNAEKLLMLLADKDPAIRYWAAIGLGSLPEMSQGARDALEKQFADSAGFVRVAAADALCRHNSTDRAVKTLGACLADSNEFVRLQAINVLDRLDGQALPVLKDLQTAANDSNEYVVRVAKYVLASLDVASKK